MDFAYKSVARVLLCTPDQTEYRDSLHYSSSVLRHRSLLSTIVYEKLGPTTTVLTSIYQCCKSQSLYDRVYLMPGTW